MNSQEIINRISKIVGKTQVLSSDEIENYLIDHRRRYHGKAIAVVRPGTVDEVRQVVRFCYEHNIPMVPQGGNTGLCGGATPSMTGDAIIISMSRLNTIQMVDAPNNTITVDAGCTIENIYEAAKSQNRLFALDLPSDGTAQIGGALASNAGGTAVLRYGNAKDMVLGVEAVLPDGRLYSNLRALRKDNTGYDIDQLLVGSEGTLGIITSAVLKLYPLPRHKSTAWLAIETPEKGRDLLNTMRAVCGDCLTAFEIISRTSIELVFKHIANTHDPMDTIYPWYVLVEVSNVIDSEEHEALFLKALEAGLENGLIEDAVVAATRLQANQLWHIRESMNDAQRIEGISIKHDISIPISKIPDFLRQTEKMLTTDYPNVRIVAFGHIGDGNIHYNVSMADPDANGPFIKKRPEINRKIYDLVDQLGGSFSAEHGIGQLKIGELKRYRGEVAVSLMAAIKTAFDPKNLMNPGKMLDQASLDQIK